MANRYADSGQDWWAANDPQLVQGGMQTQTAAPAGSTTPAGMPSLGSAQNLYANQPIGQPNAQGQSTQWQQGPQGGDFQGWFNSLFQNRPFNQQTLLGLEPLLNANGIKLTPPNASGDRTKIQLPDGTWVRVGFGEGHPVWNVQPGQGGQGGTGGAPGGGAYAGPGAIPPPFQSPSLQDFQQNDPGYMARMQMGQQALERSAASQGSLLSGGFQKSLNRYAQDYASNEYQGAYNRSYNNYMGNYQTQTFDPQNRYLQLYGIGANAAAQTKTSTPVVGS